MLPAFGPVIILEILDQIIVIRSYMPGFGGDLLSRFHIQELGPAVEIKIQFFAIQNMKYDNLLFVMAKVFQAGHDILWVIKQV